jgi:transposase
MDTRASTERRQLAKRLLGQGLRPKMVAKQLGVSPSWIYAVRQELNESQRSWQGTERRRGIDRRCADMQQTLGHLMPQRRHGIDRRCHAT